MSFTNCPELSLTFWRSMNDVPGRQLAAAALCLSPPAGRHRRHRRRRCRPPRYRRRRPSVSSLPRRWRPFCRRRPLRRRRYRRRPAARPTEGPTAAAAGSSGGGGEWRSPLALATTEVRRRPQSPQPRPPRIATSTSDLATTDLPLRPRHVGGHRPLRPQRAEDAPPRGAHQALQSGLHDGKRFRSLAGLRLRRH